MKVVVGFGLTGISAIRYLCQQGEQVIAMDSREQPPNLEKIRTEFPNVTIITGGLKSELLNAATEIIVSPGLSLKTPELVAARQHGVSCVGDIELFARAAQAPIIAITGSNGKTTLTTLVGQLLRDAGKRVEVCGNIGTPVLDILEREVPDYYVMELSSFQLETTFSLQAAIAVVLNVTPDHMDRYDSLDDYAAAKLRIYTHCQTAIINADEHYTKQLAHPAKLIFANCCGDAVNFYMENYQGVPYFYHDEQPLFAVSELACQGQHHYQNALAALAIGTALNVSVSGMQQTLHHFSGLPHRCQKVASADDIDWYNDSKATNIGATIAALNTLAPLYDRLILIAGGDAKGADLSELGPLSQHRVTHAVLLGAAAPQLESVFAHYVPTTRVTSLEQAVAVARQHTAARTAVLLSPACASWDMFANYEERGNLFIRAVQEMLDANGFLTQS